MFTIGGASLRPHLAVLLCAALCTPGTAWSQDVVPAVNQKYMLTVVEGASTSKRVKKGQVSSQAVVKLTDENNVPVAGIAVLFTLPNLTGGGAAFAANGGLTSIVTTNALGVASSGTFTTTSAASFSVTAAASAPGGVVTAVVPISLTAAAAAGVSTGLLVGIILGVGAAAGVGIAVATKGGGGSPAPTPPSAPSGTIGSVGTIVFK